MERFVIAFGTSEDELGVLLVVEMSLSSDRSYGLKHVL